MLCTHKTNHQVNKTGGLIHIKNDVQTCASRRSLKKREQTSNWNLQGPFNQSPEWVRKRDAYALMVPTATTGRMSITTTMTVTSKSRHVGVCTHIPRTTQLQQASIRSNWNGSPHARQTTQTTNIRTTLQKGIWNRNIVCTLPMPDNLDKRPAQHTCIGSSLAQTQIPDQPNSHPRR